MDRHRTALVTGANRGIGLATAAELLGRGLRVVITARCEQDAHRASAELGERSQGEVLDVTDPDSVKRLANRIGTVDVLVCNAGVLLDARTDPLSVPLELVERTLAVNLLGSWRLAQAFVPDMIRRKWGRVVFVSSGTATFSNGLFAGTPGYSASKTALNGLTTMLATQAKESGVLVNAVNPGRTKTRMMPSGDRSPAAAATDVANAATLPDGGPTGALLRGSQRIPW